MRRSKDSRSETRLSERDAIKWEAAHWVERHTADEPFDDPAFHAWLAGDPRRRPAFDAMWRRTMGPDMDETLRKATRRLSINRATVASGLALLVLAGGHKALPAVELQLAEPEIYTAAPGKVREVRLSDGTELTLAGGADVEVRYTRHRRVVELTRGLLFADVAQDPRRPFRVDAGNARIVDIGTSFEVLRRRDSVRVTVASGVVKMRRKHWFHKPVSLTATQAAVLDDDGLTKVADVGLENVAPWRSEWVEYKGAPLSQVIADLQSLSPLLIRIADTNLASRPVSGRIRLTDPIGQLRNLSITHGFEVRQETGALVIAQSKVSNPASQRR